MKLTKLQRYTAYCILLEEAEDVISNEVFDEGLCRLYWDLSTDDKPMIREDLPELHEKLQGINKDYYLYDTGLIFDKSKSGWTDRINLLKACIAETAPKD